MSHVWSLANSITADDRANNSAVKNLSDVGQIKVTLQKCRESGVKASADWTCEFKGVGDHAVPEKALKGRSISSHTK
jgi:hypothetical protein